ncbi:hypothetical protein JHK86_050102 [Glycine max]|nr:hypothetical protein JHK86_050102 [Glycine max]
MGGVLEPAKLYKLKHLSKVEEFCAYMSNASGSELKIWRARENSKDVLQGTYEKGQKFWKKFRILLCCMPLNSKGKDFVNAKNKQLQGRNVTNNMVRHQRAWELCSMTWNGDSSRSENPQSKWISGSQGMACM